MKRDVRAPVIRLLTVAQAADRLGLTEASVDRLVATGDLLAVSVSPHGGRRFWPADVDVCASARTALPESSSAGDHAIAIDLDSLEPVLNIPVNVPLVTSGPPHRGRSQFELTPGHPRWPRYEVAPERATSSYLAFRDAEHVTAYLRARATLELDSTHSVHREPARPPTELVPV